MWILLDIIATLWYSITMIKNEHIETTGAMLDLTACHSVTTGTSLDLTACLYTNRKVYHG
jgi:hypothetical protein